MWTELISYVEGENELIEVILEIKGNKKKETKKKKTKPKKKSSKISIGKCTRMKGAKK